MEQTEDYYYGSHGHETTPLTPPPQESSQRQVFLRFSHDVIREFFHHIPTHPPEYSFIGTTDPDPLITGFWMDYDLFTREETAYDILFPYFSDVLHVPEYYHVSIGELILGDVQNFVLSLPAETRAIQYCVTLVQRVSVIFFEERVLVDMVLRESMREFEMMNCGMVPTAPEALKLRCVKVRGPVEETEIGALEKRNVIKESSSEEEEEEEICTICLEEFEEFAAAMPCKHVFHEDCIVQWLKTSHYCPICRFEMPTVA